MRTFLALTIITCVVGFLAAYSVADDNDAKAQKTTTVNGVLIDQHCGPKMLTKDDPEKAAAAHTKACATAEDCEKAGYAVISGKEMIKFDDAGNKLAKDFLAKTDKADNLRVTVEGTRTGDTLAVTSLKAEGEGK